LSVDFESLHRTLKHPIRRKIVLTLFEKRELAYVELMNLVDVENTGKLNYHIKNLGDLIKKDENGKYCLTEKGQLASQFLLKFPEKRSEQTPLRFGDAILIGFGGFVLMLINPGFWSLALVGTLGMGVLPILSIILLVYALIVPSRLMWWLSIRRSHSHDPYDLFKPPFITFVLTMLLIISMVLLNVRVAVTFSAPLNGSSHAMGEASLLLLLLFGLISSFLGVGISEFVHRVRKK